MVITVTSILLFSTSVNVKNQKTFALAFYSPHHTACGLILK